MNMNSESASNRKAFQSSLHRTYQSTDLQPHVLSWMHINCFIYFQTMSNRPLAVDRGRSNAGRPPHS